ncbi:alpha/beta fold hydrolase [Chitinophagaceae bacterium MMS25-I14]
MITNKRTTGYFKSSFLAVCSFSVLMFFSCSNKGTGTSQGTADTAKTADVSQGVQPAAPPAGFKHATATVNGIRIHYVTGGQGTPLLLLHGFGQNWYMWNRLLPEFGKHFTVIAPDLPGVGESGKPVSGYDKKTMAADMHELMKQLGYSKISLAGHDIGLMVAYAYAVQYENEVSRLALVDALIPGVEPVWSQARDSKWWFGFFARPVSGEIVAGKEGLFLTDFWPQVGHVKDPFTKEETDEFIRAYAQPGATTGAFHWFGAFEEDAKVNAESMKHKLKIPVLALSGEFSGGSYFTDHIKLVAQNVQGIVVPGIGHWMVQEGTAPTGKALLDFFTAQ